MRTQLTPAKEKKTPRFTWKALSHSKSPSHPRKKKGRAQKGGYRGPDPRQ
jgi:hypothetical protein